MKHIRKENKLGKALALVLSICMVAGMLNFGALMSSAAENSAGGGTSSVETSSDTPEGEELPSEESTPAEKTPEPQDGENPPDETDQPQETPSIEEPTPAPSDSGEVSDVVEEATPAPEDLEESELESSEDEHAQDSEDLPPEVTPPPAQEEPEIEESTPAPDDSGEVYDAVEETTPSPEEGEPEAEPSETEQSQGTDVMPIADGDVAILNDTDGEVGRYSTITEAISNLGDGQYIKLLNNITENVESDSKDFVLDLDDHTVYGNKSGSVFTINGGTVTIKNGTITGGANDYGGGIRVKGGYSSGGSVSLTFENLKITNCEATIQGGGLYASTPQYVTENDIIVFNNVTFSNNKAPTGAAAFLSMPAKVTGCTFSANTSTKLNDGSTDGDIVHLAIPENDDRYILEDSVAAFNKQGGTSFENCTFTDNNSVKGTIVVTKILSMALNIPVKFEGCSIKNNESEFAGGVFVESGNVTLGENTVIEKNTATAGTGEGVPEVVNQNYHIAGGVAYTDIYEDYGNGAHPELHINGAVIKNNTATGTGFVAGGVKIDGEYFTFQSGAIYNNKCTNSSYWGCDINRSGYSSDTIIAANEMKDGSEDFSAYHWRDEEGHVIEPENLLDGEHYQIGYFLTAWKSSKDPVANADGKGNFYSLEDAIKEAKNSQQENHTITLTAGTSDVDMVLTTEGNIGLDFPVTIDFNGRSLFLTEDKTTLFNVTGNNVHLKGNGKTDEDAEIIVNGDGRLYLGCSLPVMNLKLENATAESAVLFAEEGFSIQGSLNITLPDNLASQLNNTNTQEEDITVVLLECKNGVGISDLLEKIKITNETNPHVLIEIRDGKLVAVNPGTGGADANGLYVSSKGNDSTGNGNLDKPFLTVEKAIKELRGEDGTIYLLDTVTVTEKRTWQPTKDGQEVAVKRYSNTRELNGAVMVDVTGNLTLKNITLDGESNKGLYDHAGSIVNVKEGGKLVLESGAKLRNNDVSSNPSTQDNGAAYSGGAVYSKGSVIMNEGSLIAGNSAGYGGGIALYGEKASMTMNGGEISNNRADTKDNMELANIYASGGGILLVDYASLKMVGGKITNNFAHDGGGISVGTAYAFPNSLGDKVKQCLEMKGGSITNNKSVQFGGGIYIQTSYKAVIYAGNIKNNQAGGNYGGGGIYVNGYKKNDGLVEDGELYLYNVLITNNSAKESGGGIAVCDTGNFTIYENEGGIIYSNRSDKYGEDDILSSVSREYSNPDPNIEKNDAEDHIGFYMMDGTPYNWKRLDSGHQGEAADYAYLNSAGGKHIYTESEPSIPEGNAAIKTFITENSANIMGGGIGSNGRTFIGNDGGSLTVSKEVTGAAGDTEKIWHFDIHVDGVKGEHTGWLWDSETHKFIEGVTVNFSEGGNYTAELKHNQTLEITGLPQGAKYSVTEQEANKDGYQTSWKVVPETLEEPDKIPEDSIVEVAFTNHKPGGGLTVSKTVTGTGDKEKKWNFTVELSDKSITGVFGEMEFKNGVAAFTLKDSETKTAEKLPAGITYEVTEKEADKDGYETSFTGNTGEIREDKIATASFVNSRSGNSTPPNWWWPPLTVWPSSTPGTPPTESPTPSPTPGISVEPTPGAPSTPPAPPSDSPPTGDESDAGFWAVMAGVSLIGILSAGAGYFVSRRKRLRR